MEIFLKNSEQRAPTKEEISLVLNGVLRALTLTHSHSQAHTHIHTLHTHTQTCKELSIQPIQSEIAQLQLETRSQPQRPKPETKQHTHKKKKKESHNIFVLYITHIDKHNPVMIATSHTHTHTQSHTREIAMPHAHALQLAGHINERLTAAASQFTAHVRESALLLSRSPALPLSSLSLCVLLSCSCRII